MDGTEVGVLEEADQIGFTRLLKSHDRVRLEAQISLKVLRDLAHEALEGELANQELGRLLVPADLAKGNCARGVTVGLLDASSSRNRFASRLGGKKLTQRFAASRLPGSLFGACHLSIRITRCALLRL